MEERMMEIGKKIRLFREQLKLSQKDLANLIFVSEATIGHYETGIRIPPVDKLELLSNAFDVDMNDLMYDVKKTEDDWFDYFYRDTKKAKKTMDEKRFRLMLARMFTAFENFKETKEEIQIEDYVFSKTLSEKLNPLVSETLNFNIMCRFPNHHWVINGYVEGVPFEFEINTYKQRARMDSKIENNAISLKMKAIAVIFKQWFEETYPDVWLKTTFEMNLYLMSNIQEVVNERVPNGILTITMMKRIDKSPEKRKYFWHIRGLLQTSEDDIVSIPDIHEYEIEQIENFKKRIKKLIGNE